MSTRRRINLSAALVVLSGSVYLSAPATAEPVLGCPDTAWYAAAKRADAFCGGPSSFVGYCDSNGNFVVTEVHCQSMY